jgi:glycosyltransferase involved in cell wall biosynthesis
MSSQINNPIRVLYSFPNKLGAQRICYTAWQQVNGLAAAGAKVTVFTGGLLRPVPEGVTVSTTLARGKLRIPYKLIGSNRAMALHDYIVSRKMDKLEGQFDIVHTWPQGARKTIDAAKKLGIPVVLERCNAHTRFAYEVVKKECERLGVALPPCHESAFNENILRVEEAEFWNADRLLCPSDFVVKTFLDRGFAPSQLVRHIYGFDEKTYYPGTEARETNPGLTMLFVGVCAVRKGVHYALEAWLRSPASKDGMFLIAGEFLPAYQKKLAPMLAHPSVKVLGHRTDVPELMRKSDILVLPSIEEGFGLVIAEAMASGCVPLASNACSEICSHMKTGLMHEVGDVDALTRHITLLHEDRALLGKLRTSSLAMADHLTWTEAGATLLRVYRQVIEEHKAGDTRGRRDEVILSVNGGTPVSACPTTNASFRPTAADDNQQFTRKYVLISPVRDEEQYIEKTLQSVVGQSITPAEWIIIDDGSHDATGKIIDKYAQRFPWIVAVHRNDRGRRLAGTGVMEAFHYGYEHLRDHDWQFIGKLDGDVGLEPDYYETCMRRFADESSLGICGGLMYCQGDGHLNADKHPMKHVRGAVKFYRRSCWEGIGGLIKSTGWDTVDEVHANMLGWTTRTLPDLKVLHYRPTGEAAGAWCDSAKNGRADYVSGYHPLFILFKCLRRSFQKPYLIKSVAHAYGYVSCYAKRMPRVENKELIHFIRKQQLKRLLFVASSWK